MNSHPLQKALAATALAGVFLMAPTASHAALKMGKIQRNEIAYIVRDMDTGLVLAALNEMKPMNPASTMKLVTAYSVLATYGPHFRYVNEWKTRSPVVDGFLEGNLYWRGTGSPVFDQPDLIDMQYQLMNQGIRGIHGNLVLDRSVWGAALAGIENNVVSGFGHDNAMPYVTPPDPHSIAYKVTWLEFGIRGGSIEVATDPPLVNYRLSMRTKLGKGRSCAGANRLIRGHVRGDVVEVVGTVPRGCDGDKTFINILDNLSFIKESFLGQWKKLGGIGPDNIRVGEMPAQGLQTVARSESPELSEIVKLMNKFSNNLIARSLFLQMGANTQDALLEARSRVEATMQKTGINTGKFIVDNGSGLSRKSRITARTMADLLYQAYYAPFNREFIESLPISGVDGTMKSRLREYPQVRMKTGTLDGVRALAGYYIASSPRERNLAIVVFVNSGRKLNFLPDIDELVRDAVAKYSPKPGATPPNPNQNYNDFDATGVPMGQGARESRFSDEAPYETDANIPH